MSKLTAARAGVPSAKPFAPSPPHSGRIHLVRQATLVFLEQGADRARWFLGSGKTHLMKKVWDRAKYLERCAKRANARHAFAQAIVRDRVPA